MTNRIAVFFTRCAFAYVNAACSVGLLFAGDGCAGQVGELGRHFGCCLAQTTAQE